MIDSAFIGGSIRSLWVRGNYAYIAGDRYCLRSFDITDPYNITPVDSLRLNKNAFHLFIRGYYAYVSCWLGGLLTIDIRNPDSLVLTNIYDNGEYAHSSFIRKNTAFVAECRHLSILDITDEENPVELGSVFIDAGDTRGVWVEGDYAYVASSGGHGGLRVVNVSNLINPVLVGRADPILIGMPFFIKSRDPYVYVPTSPGYALYIFDVEDETNPYIVDSLSGLLNSSNVFIKNNYLFVASYDSGLTAYTILDPAHPQFAWRIGRRDVVDVFATSEYVYFITHHILDYNSYLFVIDFSETPIGEDEPSPEHLFILKNYPNPFNAQTTISYSLPETGPITLTIYNLLGQKVATLFEGIQNAGEYNIVWDTDSMSSGVYFARLTSGDYTKTINMALQK